MSGCCLTPNQQFFRREQVKYEKWDGNDVSFVVDQLAGLDLYSASLLKQRHVDLLGHNIRIPSQPVIIYSLMLRAELPVL